MKREEGKEVNEVWEQGDYVEFCHIKRGKFGGMRIR